MKLLSGLIVLLSAVQYCSGDSVTISGRQLFLNGQPYSVKGVDYSVIPIGQSATTGTAEDVNADASIYNRDLPLIQAMGANTIRLYTLNHPSNYPLYKDFLDQCYGRGIRVMLGYWVPTYTDYGNSNSTWDLINGFADMVNQFKNHPAIFAWVFGNELNSWTQNHDGLWNMINIAKITAHNVEGGLYHPFTTAVADMTNIGDYIKSYDYAVDFWALQVYRGNSFKDLFDVFAERSSKPMIISEFGIDAWNANTNSEDQASQAQWLSSLYGEILARKDVCSGGVVFSFADEWWKSGGDPNVHTTNGYGCASYDGTCNEGWYGLCSVAPGTPNVVTPRQAYYTIQNMMKSQTAFQ